MYFVVRKAFVLYIIDSYIDKMNMGSAKIGKFDAKRGPDPINNLTEFCENILNNKKRLKQQICTTMLNQSYFNGIGNYLRAEILHRAGISPFEDAYSIFENTTLEQVKNSDYSDPGARIILLCQDIPNEVLNLNLNKYGTPEEIEKFESWLQVYGKGSYKVVNKRKIYYDPNVTTTEATTCTSKPILSDEETLAKKLLSITKLVNNGDITILEKRSLKNMVLSLTVPENEIDYRLLDLLEQKSHNISLPLQQTKANSTLTSPSSNNFVSSIVFESDSWYRHIGSEFEKPYFSDLQRFISNERSTNIIYPPSNEVFTAFNVCPFDQIKVVIFGQDPYHGPNQAHGLCFSVKPGNKIPPSLRNIYKELEHQIPGFESPSHGYLLEWAKQGVFMINDVLTVEHKKANSHKGKGWEKFTEAAIKAINEHLSNVVFLLWGRSAGRKEKWIDSSKHLVLKSGHPSPLSVKHFRGNGHFISTNEYLANSGKDPIIWNIT
eukprot:TRINITY_DN6966_c0_g1_i3.p1 TRINITY_DN6966_c0_g1~~TRINITY_DN6966_c0_g1_i3.p1  ORF type:complete len:492 (-),score=95.25 TRINITY_DN6966_c0_g1_i3:47-1522(-)